MKAYPFLLAALLLSPFPCRAAETYELTVSHMFSTIHPIHANMAEVAQRLEEKSGGRLHFQIFDNSTLAKPEGQLKAVRDGGADLVLAIPHFLVADLPYAYSHSVPFLVSDVIESSILMYRMCALPPVKAELDRNNAEMLWAASSERPGIGSLHIPVRRPEDLKGRRVLIWQANLAEEVKEWGGIPVQIGIPDTYVALQRGMGEMLYGPLPMFSSLKLQELIKYITIMPTTLGGQYWLINKDSMAALPADLQKLLRDETGEAESARMGAAIRDDCAKGMEDMRKDGVEIIELSEEQLQPWKESSVRALTPYWHEVLQRGGEQAPDTWIKKLHDMAAALEHGN